MISTIFCIGTTTVGGEIYSLIPLVHTQLKGSIHWPSEQGWRGMLGSWPKLSHAVGAIDGTSHEVYRPSIEPQEHFYSGHRQ